MDKINRAYTKEFKQDAVRLALKSRSIKSAANNLGIPEGTLNTWIRNTGKETNTSTENVIDYADEVKTLRKENARLKEEREILKKFATFIAKESN